MARSDSELSEDQVSILAFEHVGQMSRLLHAAGQPELAALLDGLTDVGELQRRRIARGQDDSVNTEVLDYVLAQLGDLALLLDHHGQPDAALLLRFPAEFVAKRREAPMHGDPVDLSADANDAM